ncbi:uncharacterized protein PV07_10372 [Cladophialophora immunda]|uniref:Uncharacterized protein n=1 Tax=Cladophialophora immunda TaxID=569365 RepID=A0A0D2C2H4_9EURO|nr:uncharacterized protein PV07_10372 [Cladophialophora immunda]KIW24670.1 hypothetical protein PV07_10372 [Cladophialophora immunda]
MSASTTTTTNTTEQILARTARLVGETSFIEPSHASPSVTSGSPSDHTRANNPAWWPTDHRRIPNYRQVRYHPEWHELSGNSLVADVFILVLFKGCGYLAMAERILRRLGFENNFFTSRIAGEW